VRAQFSISLHTHHKLPTNTPDETHLHSRPVLYSPPAFQNGSGLRDTIAATDMHTNTKFIFVLTKLQQFCWSARQSREPSTTHRIYHSNCPCIPTQNSYTVSDVMQFSDDGRGLWGYEYVCVCVCVTPNPLNRIRAFAIIHHTYSSCVCVCVNPSGHPVAWGANESA
jgi:hypothetical protein